MIKSLRVENFKGFKKLDLPEVSRITLIGGRNNVGKTSLLESIFLFYDIGDPGVFLRLLAWRGLETATADANMLIAPIFRDFNLEHHIKITLRDNIYDSVMEMIFDPALAQKSISVELPDTGGLLPPGGTDQFLLISYAIDIRYTIGGLREQKIRLAVRQSPTNLNIQFEPGPTSAFPSGMMHGAAFFGLRMKVDPMEDAVRFGQVDVEGRTNQVLEVLRVLEPNLVGLSSVALPPKSLLYADIGLSRKIPVIYMGDGISRLLSIILAIATVKDGIVLIDEMDAGLHYSVLSKVWEGVCRAAQKFNCQVIATTHSYECLQAAYEGVAQANIADEFRYVRLDRLDKDIVATTYTHEILGAALERGWEVR